MSIIDSSKLKISNEYIRGLIEGEGCFTFSTTGITIITDNGERIKEKLPTFTIAMHERDEELLRAVRNNMGLIKNTVYNHKPYLKDGYKRGRMARFLVRDLRHLRNIIVPFFYKKLHGNKGRQFEQWIETIGNDPSIPFRYKNIYFLYKQGFYEKNYICE